MCGWSWNGMSVRGSDWKEKTGSESLEGCAGV